MTKIWGQKVVSWLTPSNFNMLKFFPSLNFSFLDIFLYRSFHYRSLCKGFTKSLWDNIFFHTYYSDALTGRVFVQNIDINGKQVCVTLFSSLPTLIIMFLFSIKFVCRWQERLKWTENSKNSYSDFHFQTLLADLIKSRWSKYCKVMLLKVRHQTRLTDIDQSGVCSPVKVEWPSQMWSDHQEIRGWKWIPGGFYCWSENLFLVFPSTELGTRHQMLSNGHVRQCPKWVLEKAWCNCCVFVVETDDLTRCPGIFWEKVHIATEKKGIVICDTEDWKWLSIWCWVGNWCLLMSLERNQGKGKVPKKREQTSEIFDFGSDWRDITFTPSFVAHYSTSLIW